MAMKVSQWLHVELSGNRFKSKQKGMTWLWSSLSWDYAKDALTEIWHKVETLVTVSCGDWAEMSTSGNIEGHSCQPLFYYTLLI